MAIRVNNVEILKEIAERHGLELEEVARAVKHQFQSVHRTIKEGEFCSVKLPFFGKFHVDPQHLAHLQAIDPLTLKGPHHERHLLRASPDTNVSTDLQGPGSLPPGGA